MILTKKNILSFISLIFFAQIQAQYDPQALAILDAMSKKYKQIDGFKAEFSQQLINKSVELNENISGQITVKGDKYILNISSQRIFNNGIDVFTYNPEIKEVTINTYNPEESEISIGNIYDIYKKGFKYALLETTSNGNRIIELDPESREENYFKIRMTINSKEQLISFMIFERNGNKYIYTIHSFIVTNIPDDHFTFNPSKYPNVEIIDFR